MKLEKSTSSTSRIPKIQLKKHFIRVSLQFFLYFLYDTTRVPYILSVFNSFFKSDDTEKLYHNPIFQSGYTVNLDSLLSVLPIHSSGDSQLMYGNTIIYYQNPMNCGITDLLHSITYTFCTYCVPIYPRYPNTVLLGLKKSSPMILQLFKAAQYINCISFALYITPIVMYRILISYSQYKKWRQT